ncbi:hypothetical protein [Wolbachia endosymbiont of Ctenocephalides felis wCfeT]|uniref:hypothetical protein n=1 Tax=Wolbachia endosymbiont of Ctenocephalides felis wCfeT TaxID=2732593 RepID=UPI00144891CB|nr:hypothetical protein [Wolbachia endosymbiont of Ctenocephalides felis wCfeT]
MVNDSVLARFARAYIDEFGSNGVQAFLKDCDKVLNLKWSEKEFYKLCNRPNTNSNPQQIGSNPTRNNYRSGGVNGNLSNDRAVLELIQFLCIVFTVFIDLCNSIKETARKSEKIDYLDDVLKMFGNIGFGCSAAFFTGFLADLIVCVVQPKSTPIWGVVVLGLIALGFFVFGFIFHESHKGELGKINEAKKAVRIHLSSSTQPSPSAPTQGTNAASATSKSSPSGEVTAPSSANPNVTTPSAPPLNASNGGSPSSAPSDNPPSYYEATGNPAPGAPHDNSPLQGTSAANDSQVELPPIHSLHDINAASASSYAGATDPPSESDSTFRNSRPTLYKDPTFHQVGYSKY